MRREKAYTKMCKKCGKPMIAIAHGQTEVLAFYVCFDCKLIKDKEVMRHD